MDMIDDLILCLALFGFTMAIECAIKVYLEAKDIKKILQDKV